MASRNINFFLRRSKFILNEARLAKTLPRRASNTPFMPCSSPVSLNQASHSLLVIQPSQCFSSTAVTYSKKTRNSRQSDLSLREAAAVKGNNERFNIKVLDHDGVLLGVMLKEKAKGIAIKQNLKLFCVNEESKPNTYMLMTGMEAHQEKMRQKREKLDSKKLAPEKLLKLSLNISEHDLGVKFKHVHELLTKRHPVKIISKMNLKDATEEMIAERQADLFRKLRTEFSEVGEVTEASRKKGELMVLIKPIEQAEGQEELVVKE